MADSPQKAVKSYVILDSFSFKMCPEWIIFSHFVRCYNISNIDNFIFKNCLTYLICHRLGNDSLTKWWTLCYFRLFYLWNALYKIISIFANVVIFLRNWKSILCRKKRHIYICIIQLNMTRNAYIYMFRFYLVQWNYKLQILVTCWLRNENSKVILSTTIGCLYLYIYSHDKKLFFILYSHVTMLLIFCDIIYGKNNCVYINFFINLSFNILIL